MAEELRLTFWGICGATRIDRSSLTKSSAASVIRFAVGARLDHMQRGDAFGVAVAFRQASVDEKGIAVLHQRMKTPAISNIIGPSRRRSGSLSTVEG